MKSFSLSVALIMTAAITSGQDTERLNNYYKQIPPAAEAFTAGAVAARVVDGLGFRFYWATEGLTEKDMNYQLGNDTRTIAETIDHIYSMTAFVYRVVYKQDPGKTEIKTAMDKREKALLNLELISRKLSASSEADFGQYNLEAANGKVYPFWNMLSGPIEDCVWHCGQIVSLRRLSGNPFDGKVSLMEGKRRD